MLPKCQENTKSSLLQTTVQHINQFATEGLRTLAVAVKTLTPEDYQEFAQSCAKVQCFFLRIPFAAKKGDYAP